MTYMENLLAFPITGASSVDYGIASEGLFQFIFNFSVSRQEIYSDHCEISLSIPGKAFSKINTEAYKWSTMPRPFIWNKESIQPFQNIMSSPVMENELNKFLSETFSYEVNDVEKANSTLNVFNEKLLQGLFEAEKLPQKKIKQRTEK